VYLVEEEKLPSFPAGGLWCVFCWGCSCVGTSGATVVASSHLLHTSPVLSVPVGVGERASVPSVIFCNHVDTSKALDR